MHGKLSIFSLPIWYQADKADFDGWDIENTNGNPYTKKKG